MSRCLNFIRHIPIFCFGSIFVNLPHRRRFFVRSKAVDHFSFLLSLNSLFIKSKVWGHFINRTWRNSTRKLKSLFSRSMKGIPVIWFLVWKNHWCFFCSNVVLAWSWSIVNSSVKELRIEAWFIFGMNRKSIYTFWTHVSSLRRMPISAPHSRRWDFDSMFAKWGWQLVLSWPRNIVIFLHRSA